MQSFEGGRRWRPFVVAFALLLLAAGPARSDNPVFTREMLRIPVPGAGVRGLEAMLVRPAGEGRYPLALISHGSPRFAEERPNMTPLAFLPQATEFARRGWAAVVVMRRGFGDSGGVFAEHPGPCNNTNYFASTAAAVDDLRAAIERLAKRPDIDASRIIAVGQSVGGFASVRLTVDPPARLLAAISFAGGQGSPKDGKVCREDRLIAAFEFMGARSRLPMLWLYADNDRYFGPVLAQKLHAAFQGGGGQAEFVKHPAFGEDGHNLFYQGIALWTPYVDAFLKKQSLVLRETVLPVPVLAMVPPPQLSEVGRKAFADFLTAAPHKAFAVSRNGAAGWMFGQRTTEAAEEGALRNCLKYAADCRIYAVDEEVVGTPYAQ
jgi:dienelactone hydrolase